VGRCRPDLDAAILSVASWKLDSLPRHVSAEDVERIVRASASGEAPLRNHAIVLLLARLALRAADVRAIRVADIDWQRARLLVAGKGRHTDRLPLPQEVGDAILAYVKRERPRVVSEHLFLTARPPWRPFTTAVTVSKVVARSIARAGC
jgi:integrase